jgi:uncharacterized heparinase superfamily protein
MSFLAQARRYWHTVKYLRPSQTVARADLRLRAAWRRRAPAAAAARYARRALDARFGWRDDPWGLAATVPDAAALIAPDARARLAVEAEDRRRGAFTFLHERAGGDGAIDWRAPAASQLWRYHLHYFDFLPEAIAAGEPWDTVAPVLHDWIAHNRLGAADARDAWHSYVVSLRVANWIWAAAAAPAFAADAALRASLEAQILFVARNLETDVGGNHLLKNLKALAIAGCLLEGAAAARLRERFVTAFTTDLRAQLRSDGGHYEQSPMYHAQVLVDSVEVVFALRLGGHAVPDPLRDAVAAMARFLRHACHPDGQVAQFGDSAFNMTPPPAEIAAAAALALGEQWAPPVPARHALAAARLGIAGPARDAWPASVGDAPPAPHFDLESSGLYVLDAGGRGRLLADAGPTCPDDLPAHAHADLFGFEISVGGARLIVDAGVSEYRPGPWRAYERSTRAHNTVMVDGVEQSECWGSFRVAERARVVAGAAIAGAELRGFVARHDGYERLASPVRHTRQFVTVADAGWLIVDLLDGTGSHRWETFLHAHPDATVEAIGPAAWRVARGDAALRVVAWGVDDARVVRGAVDPPQGWYAPEFGRRLPASTLVLAGAGKLPARFGWLLAIEPDGSAAVRAGDDDRWIVTIGGRDVAVPVRVP